MVSPATPPAAWYPDPGSPYHHIRWWDGTAWTPHVAQAPAAAGYLGYGNPPQQPAQRERGLEALVPVNRTGLSIAAGYLGLFAIALIPAPVALAVSIFALRELRTKPDVGGRGRSWFGLVMGALGTVALVVTVVQSATG